MKIVGRVKKSLGKLKLGFKKGFDKGFDKTFMGYIWRPEDNYLAVGLPGLLVILEYEAADAAPEEEEKPSTDVCPFCDERVLPGEPSRVMPGVSVMSFDGPPKVMAETRRVHEECLVMSVHGRAPCQRGECPNCAPLPGQSKREQAREAAALWNASKGKRRAKNEAVS